VAQTHVIIDIGGDKCKKKAVEKNVTNHTKDIYGRYVLVDKTVFHEIKALKIKTIRSFHDLSEGKDRGRNLIAVIKADNMVLVHLGDL